MQSKKQNKIEKIIQKIGICTSKIAELILEMDVIINKDIQVKKNPLTSKVKKKRKMKRRSKKSK